MKNMTVISSAGSTQKRVLAAPPQPYSPFDARPCRATGLSTTEKPSPKPVPSKGVSAEHAPAEALQVGAAGQLVAGHVVDGAGPEQPHAVQLAPRPRSIWGTGGSRRRGPISPPPPEQVAGWRGDGPLPKPPARRCRPRGRAGTARRAGPCSSSAMWKPVSVMPSGSKTRVRKNVSRRCPGDDLDDPPEHVGGDGVVPFRAGLEEQRYLAQRVARVGQVEAAGCPHSKPRAR